MNIEQLNKIRDDAGFIAALDQSGGSTPKALTNYGIEQDAYANDEEMFNLIHQMRSRIMTSTSFSGDRILGAILFENTMDREVLGQSTASYLWDTKGVVPFLKVDKGLADEADGVQVMKPMPDLDSLLAKARENVIFGTKMRSVIKSPNKNGISAIVQQQFEVGKQILDAGLIPIIEPEVDIHSPEKKQCEDFLLSSIEENLSGLTGSETIMLKLTLPEEDNFYSGLIQDDRVLRVVALSGGYSRIESNDRLGNNNGMVASFSRALTEGLSAAQSDDEFDALLDSSIQSIFDASSS
ncbi:MAG: fructose bisphosphate aldolase [Acidimicrobiaceae bacterium]|nr:fructose bisphosphate aldolase [Acidimicrobiaceae bacterium]